ncbi:serine hydrolase domain-containing protein [Maribacter sp.]
MKNSNPIVILLLLLTAMSPLRGQLSEAIESELILLTDEYVKINPEASGAILAIYRKDSLPWTYSSGYKSIKKEISLQGNERFIAASITKTFVAVCMLQLEEEGLLSLEDKVFNYLDESILKQLTLFKGKSYEKQLTIRHLLQHTSGIEDYLDNGKVHLLAYQNEPNRQYTLQDRIAIALKVGSASTKLGTYHYSNTNYILLGLIAQKVTGEDIATILDKRIIQPLHLSNTALRSSKNVLPSMLKGYYTDWDLTAFTLHFNQNNPAGGILTSVHDLLVFGDAVFSGSLFKSTTTLEKMLDFKKGYGLGAMLFGKSKKTGKIVGHSGFDPGYTCYLLYLEKLKTTVVTVINQSELKVVMPAFLAVKTVAQLKAHN